jgi:hypothetical protein
MLLPFPRGVTPEAVYAHKNSAINPGTPKAIYTEITDKNGQKRVKIPREVRVVFGPAVLLRATG